MRRTLIMATVMVWLGALTFAQGQKVTTPEEYDKVMKRVGPAMQAAGKAIASGAYAEARKELAVAKAALTEAGTFWTHHKIAEAEKLAAEAASKADALDKALGAATVDPAAVKAAQGELQSTCRTCHTAYRVQDPATNTYSIKPGTIKG
jgi:cytochrome c556